MFIFPELSYDPMLKMTGIKLKFIWNIDAYFIIEKKSGAIIYIGDNYSNANNEYINDYDEYKKCTYDKYVGCMKWIVYTDNV